jgi:hypothetical protein
MGISAPPSSLLVGKTERAYKRKMSVPRKDLRKEISEVVCRLYAEDLNIPIGDAFANVLYHFDRKFSHRSQCGLN